MLLFHLELWETCLESFSKPLLVVVCTFTAALCFSWGRRCQIPVLVCNDGFRAFLHQHCPEVSERFCPTPWCWGGRLQTLVPTFLKSKPTVGYRNELIQTVDGGRICLDWADNGSSTLYPDPAMRPTVLILPGLTGNSQQFYIFHIINQASRWGYRCVVFNNRGFAGEELLTPYTFCAASTSDLERVILHIKDLFPQAPLLGAGVSLGGMLVLNYLADKGAESGLMAAITLSVCWNTQKSCDSLEQPVNCLLFNRYLAANLCSTINRNRKVLEKVVDIDYVLKSRTIREFDERFTAAVYGYQSCTDYYKDADPDLKRHRTAMPVLCLNAADDPLSPKEAFPLAAAQPLPNVALLVTAHGGHVGFLDGWFPRGECYMDRLLGHFIQAAFEHTEELNQACGVK